ncbi:response regulator transcription factor [Chitinophagaceae bacterium MMS25-I14]
MKKRVYAMKEEPVIHVAYADDHATVRKGIITFMGELGGISVDIEAGNGKDLLKQLEQAEHVPDICIIDINMPEMNGFDTLIEIKKRWPNMKTLVLTIFDHELYIIRMILNGANGYLLKSCDPTDIKKALVSIYNNGIYHSELVSSQFLHAIKNKEIKLPNFTEKELQVLKYCCSDLSYAQIAKNMNTTARSVEGYRDSLFKKLKVNSRVSLALYAVQAGITPLEIIKHN